MDLDRYYELRSILQQWRTRLAESVRQQIVASSYWQQRLRAIYNTAGADEEFTVWLDRWCRQSAIQFILRVLFLRVLEDRGLLGVTRIRTTDGQRMWGQLTRNLGAAHYVQWCCWDAGHLLPDLFGPTEHDLMLPDDDLAQRFLDDVWRRPDPDRPGWLRFDFRPDPRKEGQGFQTRFIGDLYQELDAEIRDRYAMLQTPHFVSRLILEQTLLKCFEEKDFHEVTLMDPTCGSGHFLVDAFWEFVEHYEQATGRSRERMTSVERAEIAQAVIERHLFGCDINPYATALARFRLLLAACDYAHPTSLRDFREMHFNLVTIDSLIPYEKLDFRSIPPGSALARVLGRSGTIQRALPVLKRRYDVVVGNPPYITEKSEIKRALYRERYVSAHRSFGLSAPFTERFLHLACEQGYVGLIESNAFARRLFGKKLIEEILPKYDLEAVVDLSGAYIPGHGTPTLLIFARKQAPSTDRVFLFSNMKGEPGTPTDPAKGRVWQSVRRGFAEGNGYQDQFVDVAARPRRLLAQHPWKFGGPKSRLAERISESFDEVLSNVISSHGRDIHTGLNDAYFAAPDFFRRLSISHKYLVPITIGANVRDWKMSTPECALFPYEIQSDLEVAKPDGDSPMLRYFHSLEHALKTRKNYGNTVEELDMVWYEYTYTANRDWSQSLGIAYAFISTHNHFVFSSDLWVGDRSALRLTLPEEQSENDRYDDYLSATAILNSSTVCLYLKQTSFDKRAGEEPVRDTYYEFAVSNVDDIPLPGGCRVGGTNRTRAVALAKEISDLSKDLSRLSMRKLFERQNEAYQKWNRKLAGYVSPHTTLPEPFSDAQELCAAREKLVTVRRDTRDRMIFLQEEVDWIAYDMYGLLKSDTPLAENYLSRTEFEAARLQLGQRPFEIAGKSYTGDWPEGYEPEPLPEALHDLTEARIAVMEASADVALVEDPLYKRRWVPPDYDEEFREAAEWWLAEKLEWALEQHGRPISVREWAHILGDDERVNAVLEVLTSTRMFDLEAELLKVIEANAAPNRPEHYLEPAGLRKFYAARESDPPTTPEYRRTEFSDATTWKLRGKLNIPRERFIHYAEFDHTGRGADAPDSGGPWFGWAGWDAAERADALAFLLDQANRAGWEMRWRQCGLRAALRDLLPELDDLPAAHRAEFEAIAKMCGIGLENRCYCQAYRDAVAHGEPGVPGVDADVLGVEILTSQRKRARQDKRAKKSGAEQLALDL